MAKKEEEVKEEEVKTCSECKYRELPSGKLPQRGWCSNPKSKFYRKYVYKGDTCAEFGSKRVKREAKEDVFD